MEDCFCLGVSFLVKELVVQGERSEEWMFPAAAADIKAVK